LYCVPGEVVEAVSGRDARPTIPAETLARLGLDANVDTGGGVTGGLFESLVTRWTTQPTRGAAGDKDWTDVMLTVQFQFANPALGFAVGQLVDQKVDEMIQAFQDRARTLYE
jgi:coenzyme Q-binding protein COQ10